MSEEFKESRELIEGIAAITKACIEQFSDGFQATDLPVLVGKLAVDPKVMAAVQGCGGIKTEFAAMTPEKYAEAVKELTPAIVDLVTSVILSLRAKAAA